MEQNIMFTTLNPPARLFLYYFCATLVFHVLTFLQHITVICIHACNFSIVYMYANMYKTSMLANK
nr:MAG TPA: hypothetical protein [Inoviridae sp.]